MNVTKLSTEERRIIRSVARTQIKGLRGLLNRDSSEDVVMFCINEDIDIEELDEAIREDIKVFEHILIKPRHFLKLHTDHLSTFKHILNNFVNREELKPHKYKIWRKLNITEKFLFHPN